MSRAPHQEHIELIEKRAALAQAEIAKNKTESLLSLMPGGVYTCDLDGRITYFNQGAAELWGRAPMLNSDEDKFGGSVRLQALDGTEIPLSECPMALAVKTGKPFHDAEVVIERPDGSRIIARVNIDCLYDEHGRLYGAINAFQDITDSKNAEQASRHLAALVESSDDAIIAKDLNGIVKSWNPAAEQLFGYTAAEMIGRSITTIIPSDHSDEETGILQRIRSGERIEHYDTVRQRKDGTLVEISLTISPIKDARGKIVGASKIARQITKRKQAEAALREARDELARANQDLEKRVKERTAELERANGVLLKDFEEQKRLEAQLRQAQKMESIGTLAGGIAHDFNNVLNIIKGYASSVANLSVGNEEITEQLEIIDDAIDRGTGVVRQLLTLARKTESRLISSSVNELISGLANLLKQTLPKTIDVSLELRAKLPMVMADPNQITQALLNLCVNARDAMPQGGRLVLRTSLVDGATINDAGAQPREYVCIEVIDTGTGMSDSVRARLFEPFFTTKGIGQGTGLGLAIVYGIIKNHDGLIEVHSEPDRGTKFRLYLPAAREQQSTVDAALQAEISPENGRDGHNTVLLVEDEEMMVLLLRKTFAKHGYNVLVALDGDEALNLFQEHKQKIDVVLLDIGLPKKAGWEVILTMKEENPQVSIVVSSGYIDPATKIKMYKAGIKNFVDKPYLPETVVEILDAVVRQNRMLALGSASTSPIT